MTCADKLHAQGFGQLNLIARCFVTGFVFFRHMTMLCRKMDANAKVCSHIKVCVACVFVCVCQDNTSEKKAQILSKTYSSYSHKAYNAVHGSAGCDRMQFCITKWFADSPDQASTT